MTYTKPEVAVLGEAVRVIEKVVGKHYTGTLECQCSPPNRIQPAYDLDQ